MKKVLVLIISVLLIMSGMSAYAEKEVTVILDNKKLEFDVPPAIINGRTMVPMRKIYEELGAQVDWIDSVQTMVKV